MDFEGSEPTRFHKCTTRLDLTYPPGLDHSLATCMTRPLHRPLRARRRLTGLLFPMKVADGAIYLYFFLPPHGDISSYYEFPKSPKSRMYSNIYQVPFLAACHNRSNAYLSCLNSISHTKLTSRLHSFIVTMQFFKSILAVASLTAVATAADVAAPIEARQAASPCYSTQKLTRNTGKIPGSGGWGVRLPNLHVLCCDDANLD